MHIDFFCDHSVNRVGYREPLTLFLSREVVNSIALVTKILYWGSQTSELLLAEKHEINSDLVFA